MSKASIIHALGIDISDGSLELANIHEQRSGLPSLTEHARLALPHHTIVHGHINDFETLADATRTLIAEASIDHEVTDVITALPDAQVLTKIIPIPRNSRPMRYDTIAASAKEVYQSLGYRIKNPKVQWLYREAPGTESGELTLFVAQRDSVQQWKEFFKRIGMRLVVMEMESLAIGRSLIRTVHRGETIAIIDFGFRMTNVSLFDATGLRYTHTIEYGGFDLTHSLMQALNCSIDEAERLKTTVGLVGPANDSSHTLLRDAVAGLLDQIKASLTATSLPVTKILITGGGSRLRGIRSAAENELGSTVHRGDSWLNPTHARRGHLASTAIDSSHAPYYTGALGLALRGMNRYTLAKGINFLEA